ncbi:MAG TPA: NADH:flavin oxidoreductase [Pirellulales bacterium]|nr:NADH:flavin oxidoreductase [Pirellulales bacterium]
MPTRAQQPRYFAADQVPALPVTWDKILRQATIAQDGEPSRSPKPFDENRPGDDAAHSRLRGQPQPVAERLSISVSIPKVSQYKTPAALRARLAELGHELPVDDELLAAAAGSPLAESLDIAGFRVGNRWCIQPMEGWDANPDGSPSSLTLRRWRNFGLSGAKLIWGGEAAAVEEGGRANPRQTLATAWNRPGLQRLLDELRRAHRQRHGTIDNLLVGLQLTHSGRFCRPHGARLEPRIAYHHPLLDEKLGIAPDDHSIVWTDHELERLIDRYIECAGVAVDAGFQFVDIKACHGYLLHEFLSARTRPGPFGGDLAGRSRLLMTIVGRVRDRYPDLLVGVRLSVFDSVPYVTSREVARPMDYRSLFPYTHGFGVSTDDPTVIDLSEPLELLAMLRRAGVALVNISCGSPYYTPHLQRPALFPPSDGYPPPEDPLVGAARQIEAARQCKAAFPDWPMVGTGYSYLQDFLPHVAQAVVRAGWIDFVGLGRIALSYPELPADVLGGDRWQRKRICRTFSDCTTAPRNGLVSGCYPLDDFYKELPEAETLRSLKAAAREHRPDA